MKDFIQKLRLLASTLAAAVGAVLLVGMAVSGKLALPDIDSSIRIEADIVVSPMR